MLRFSARVALSLSLAGCLGPPVSTAAFNAPATSDHGTFTVTADAQHASLVRGANTFVVHAHTNVDGSPATLTHVFAVMPPHGHTSNVPLVIEVAPGSFQVDGLDLTMAGEWRVDFTLSRTGATDDDVASVTTEVE